MIEKFQVELTEKIKYLLKSLEETDKVSADELLDEKLKESFTTIKDTIFKGINKIKYNLNLLSENAEWDKLNVSFFGETNAGKSTVIEALTNGDGRSIGEGYKDFTKIMRRVSYQKINLLDMPGIEGLGFKIRKEIRKAVNKSHIIFYVIGTNKEPEENTMKKIKQLLNGNAKVYSILNVRGRPSAYNYKRELISDNTKIIEKRIIEKFNLILGSHYFGNIIINAHLGLLKGNKLKGTRFEKDKNNALRIFGNNNEIKLFSQIKKIDETINILESNIEEEIKVSNSYKFLKNIEFILAKILREKKNFDKFINDASEYINKYLNDVDEIFKKYENEINNNLNINLNKLKISLKKVVHKSIENKDTESTLKEKILKIEKEKSKIMNNQIKEILNVMNTEIKSKINEFNNRMSLQMRFFDFKGEFDLKKVLNTLKINFKYVMGQILDMGLSIWGVIIAFGVNPILGVIAGIFVVVRKLWDWLTGDPDKRKRTAMKKANKQIDDMIKKKKIKLSQDLYKKFKQINEKVQIPTKQLKESMKNIKNVSLSIDDKISDIKKVESDLSTLLAQEILGKEIFFSYIDLRLSSMVAVGYDVNNIIKQNIANKFRIDNLNLYLSYSDWFNDVGKNIDNNIFLVKDEFNYRAINILLLKNKFYFPFNKIKKQEANYV